MEGIDLIKDEILKNIIKIEPVNIFELEKFREMLDKVFDEDGDYGIVKCGKCKKIMFRQDAFLSLKHLYLCDKCEE